jgi:adenosylcobinamide kinase/adenosylcobinamide-phosphate guanylyltransferase
MSRIVLIGGGVRSGKSAFALTLARAHGERRAFIATAQAFDDEMRARIRDHQLERAHEFTTFEEPVALARTIAGLDGYDVTVVDCLTLWLSNLLLRGDSAQMIADQIEDLVTVLERRAGPTILISNEVGMGIVPESALGRLFRDVAGRAHQRIARSASELYVAMMGIVLRVRPGPVAIASPEGPR